MKARHSGRQSRILIFRTKMLANWYKRGGSIFEKITNVNTSELMTSPLGYYARTVGYKSSINWARNAFI